MRSGPAAFGDWHIDAPGVVRLIRPGDLPPPYATPSASNGPQDAALPKEPQVHVPEGLSASLWAEGLTHPRTIRVAPSGDVSVAATAEGDIKVLRPVEGPGAAGPAEVYAKDLDGPFGMAFHPTGDDPRWLYTATTDAVFRFPYRSGDLSGAKPDHVVDLDISDGGHSTRDIAFSPDGKRMFVSVGSQRDDDEDLPAEPKAEIAKLPLRAAWDGETRRADVLILDSRGGRGCRGTRRRVDGCQGRRNDRHTSPRTRHSGMRTRARLCWPWPRLRPRG